MDKTYYMYILQCSDKSYYIGVTSELKKRFLEHQEGVQKSCYTYSKRPLQLVYHEKYQTPSEAIAREKQVKGWGRKKKKALIEGDYNALIQLAKGT